MERYEQIRPFIFIGIIGLILLMFFGNVINAQEPPPEETVIINPLPEDSPLFPIFENIIALVGVGGALVVTLTQLFKYVPGLKEFKSEHVSTFWTLVVFAAYTAFYYLGLADQYPEIVNGLNTLGTGLLGLLLMATSAEFQYRGAKVSSLPGFTKSSETN